VTTYILVYITALQDGGTITATASDIHIILTVQVKWMDVFRHLWNQQFYHLSIHLLQT